MMLKCSCKLMGMSPISFSAPIQSKKKTNEAHDAFEERTWRERLHVNPQGHAFIPHMALKNCLSEVAKYLSETIKGMGKKTYTARFEAGIIIKDDMVIHDAKGNPIRGKDVEGERLFVPSDGKRGGGTRVWKTFPTIQEWNVEAIVYAVDQILIDKPEKIEEYLGFAGKFIGMLRFRPRNNGYYGRWTVKDFVAVKVVQDGA